MKLEEAEEKLWKDGKVTERGKEGYYLSSLLLIPKDFESLDEWQFVFFHPETHEVYTAKVGESVEVGEVSKPLVEDHYEELSLDGVKPLEAMQAIKNEAKHLDPNKITKIIVTLREGVWRAALTTTDMKIIRIDVNAETNKVEKSETTSMLR